MHDRPLDNLSVRFPQFRRDVIAGLEAFSSHQLAVSWRAGESTFPSITDAVHWIIDDTWWDTKPVADSVGLLLTSPAEAEAVGAAVEAVLAVVEAVGPDSSDAAFAAHDLFPAAQERCRAALEVMQG